MNDLFSEQTTTSAEWVIAHCDGGSRGNPGPAGYGALIEDSKGRTVAELSEFLGIQTNNFAEYSGLLAVLQWAIEHETKCLRVISDSELMVKQIQGKYKVASPVLKPLYDEAKKMARRIPTFEIRHTLRGGNKDADRLANEAMDRGMGKSGGSGVSTAGGVGGAGFAGRSSAGGPQTAGQASGAPSDRAAHPAQNNSASARPHFQKPAVRPPTMVLEGYVKNGVVHLLGGSLPDGVFVKVIHE